MTPHGLEASRRRLSPRQAEVVMQLVRATGEEAEEVGYRDSPFATWLVGPVWRRQPPTTTSAPRTTFWPRCSGAGYTPFPR